MWKKKYRGKFISRKMGLRLIAILLAAFILPLVSMSLVSPRLPLEQSPETTLGDAPPIPHTLIGRADCLVCHTDGFGGAPIVPTDHGAYTINDCQNCHEPGIDPSQMSDEPDLPPGIIPTPLAHPPSEGLNTCYDCHVLLGKIHTEISDGWQASVHSKSKIGCADCHGGDPRTDEMNLSMSAEAGFIGVPTRETISKICGGCHSDVERMSQYNLPTDQYIKYIGSVHGARLEEGDTKVALCTDCHGTHEIKKTSDPSADVYPLNVPTLCFRCHSDPELMESYGIPTNQYDLYVASVHGEALLVNQDLRAPTCTSCHGSHGAKPPTDAEVVNVCGKCHTATQDYYNESLHARLEENGPKCWTCHGTHDILQPDESMFFNPEPPDRTCGTCHIDEKSFRMDKTRFASPEDRRCDTCHHEGSMVLAQVEALWSTLTEADQAYREAESTIQQAAERGMIVSDAEIKLAESHTSLTSARATLHTTKLPVVSKLTEESKAQANTAMEIAASKLKEVVFRRQALVVAIGAIVINITGLYVIKRKLYQQLKAKKTNTE